MPSDETKFERTSKTRKPDLLDASLIEPTHEEPPTAVQLRDEMAIAAWDEMATREILLSDPAFELEAAMAHFDLNHVLTLLGPVVHGY